MSAAALTLAEFLLARIAEDEAWANRGVRLPPDGNPDDPARVLAECEAKRRILKSAANMMGPTDAEEWLYPILAAVYSDHPHYRDEWKP